MIYDTIKKNSLLNTSIGNFYVNELFDIFNNGQAIFCSTINENQFNTSKIVEFKKIFGDVNKYTFSNTNQFTFIEAKDSINVYNENFSKIKIRDLEINNKIKLLIYKVKYSLDIYSTYEKKFFDVELKDIEINNELQESYFIRLENNGSLIVNNFLIHLNKYINEEE